MSTEVAKRILPDVTLAENAYEAAQDADALMVITEWNEFRNLDMARVLENMAGDVLIDGRNIYDPVAMAALGFRYTGVGRAARENGPV